MAKLIIEDYLKHWQEYEMQLKGLKLFKDSNPEAAEEYNEIMTTMKWIQDLLSILDEREQYIITEFYYKKEKADFICNRLDCSKSYFFRKKKAILIKMNELFCKL